MSARESRERDLVKCEDMRLHAERARQFLGTRSLDKFVADEMAQAAVIRCIEVIGEAARLVSEETGCDTGKGRLKALRRYNAGQGGPDD